MAQIEESKDIDRILEQERLIDTEIKQEIDKYKLSKQIGLLADLDIRQADEARETDMLQD